MAIQYATWVYDTGTAVKYLIADTFAELPVSSLAEGWLAYAKDDNKLYRATDATTWTEVGGGSGAPSTANYLVGTADAGLSNEIAVGTTPGGELSGTWGSPTVDPSHAGGTHAATQAAAEATAAAADSAHAGAADPHAGYRLESADHTHATTGAQAGQLAQSNTHQSPDTDSGSSALHHTLGTGAAQAAAGSHTHAGGSLNVGTATLNFGAFPGAVDAFVAVTGQAGIVSGSIVHVQLRPVATADHTADEHWVEELVVIAGNIVAATGFTVYGKSISNRRLYGQWTVAWLWT